MPTPELIALVLQGGAVVVLLFWNWDLRAERKVERDRTAQERAERIENAAVLRTVGSALGELTSAIHSITDDRSPRTRR